MYESELTQFIKKLHNDNRHLKKQQKDSQALWSNQPQNEIKRKVKEESTIPPNAYNYYPR